MTLPEPQFSPGKMYEYEHSVLLVSLIEDSLRGHASSITPDSSSHKPDVLEGTEKLLKNCLCALGGPAVPQG